MITREGPRPSPPTPLAAQEDALLRMRGAELRSSDISVTLGGASIASGTQGWDVPTDKRCGAPLLIFSDSPPK